VEFLFAAIGLRSVTALRAGAAVADAELVSRFQSGERRAFDEIVMRYQARIYSLCLRWLGDPAAAEEQAQDVFVAAFRALGGFRNECSLSTWLFRIAVNHCRNQRLYRMRRAYGRHETFDAPREDDEGPARQLADEEAPAADRAVHVREAGSLVQAALAELDEEHRQILILRDVEDLAYEDIADILDLPRGTVKSRIHRARAELAQKLARRVRAADVL
jgi:RNA polymerase sigma-70 factor (ECF subfamily)